MTTLPAVLQVTGLHFAYPGRPLFSDWSGCLPPGLTLVQGGEGCGKTTLLKLLAGELPATAGSLAIGALALASQPEAYRQQLFRTDPRAQAHDALSPRGYFSALPRRYPRFSQEALSELVDGFALEPHLDKRLDMLSTGTRRKVWLAAAFAAGTTVTLLDEPFAALDRASIGFLLELLQDVARHPSRAWVVADHAAHPGLPPAAVIDLGD
jgi:ABC-type multidrug transport system ATPase subunit